MSLETREIVAESCLVGVPYFLDSLLLQSLAEPVPATLPEDYRQLFDMGWRYHPQQEGKIVPKGWWFGDKTAKFLIIYCQVSGRRIGPWEGPFLLNNPDGLESVFVCKDVKNWLITERGWKETK